MKPNRLQYARLYHQDGRLRDAEELYRQLLVEHPEDAGICCEAGRLADDLGTIELAISRLQRARELDSSDACGGGAALARVLMHAGQIRQAGLHWLRLTRPPPPAPVPQVHGGLGGRTGLCLEHGQKVSGQPSCRHTEHPHQPK